MAEAWLRHSASEKFQVESAGIEPGKLNPHVVKAMALSNIDISHHQPKGVSEVLASGRTFDYVIAVCDKEAAERCPIFPGETHRLHWNFPDPSAVVGSDEDKLSRACEVREMIREKILEWIAGLD